MVSGQRTNRARRRVIRGHCSLALLIWVSEVTLRRAAFTMEGPYCCRRLERHLLPPQLWRLIEAFIDEARRLIVGIAVFRLRKALQLVDAWTSV